MWDDHRSWPAQRIEHRMLRKADTHVMTGTAGELGPGDVVWAWVPYGRAAGDGKDRPCAIVAREPDRGTVLAIPLTTREHEDDGDYLFLGYGEWNERGPASWAHVAVLLRISERGVRARLGRLDRMQLRALHTVLRIGRR